MPKKSKIEMWFGCYDCNYEPKRDESQSNNNWNVFKPGKCPDCGEEMKINFDRKIKEL